MRNVDRIKILENQLAHERRRVKELTALVAGAGELHQAMDAILYSIAEAYGEERREEPEDGGALIGWHLQFKKPDVKNVLHDQVRVTRGEDGIWYVGVLATEQRIKLDAERGAANGNIISGSIAEGTGASVGEAKGAASDQATASGEQVSRAEDGTDDAERKEPDV